MILEVKTDVDWSADALAEQRSLLREHGGELWDEAVRIANRRQAGSVSPAYVKEAAVVVGVRRPTSTAGADIVFGTGGSLFFFGAGIGASATPHGWRAWLTLVCLIVGALMIGIGLTLKMTNRK